MSQNCRIAREVVQKSRDTFSAISHYRLLLLVQLANNDFVAFFYLNMKLNTRGVVVVVQKKLLNLTLD